jgi:hypothetical protein
MKIMGLFDKIKEPVFYKEDYSLEKDLERLQILRGEVSGKGTDLVDQAIQNVQYGITGEKNIEFELKNSHYPMIIMHDIYLRRGDLSAQIDYLVVTRGYLFFIECKNLYGNITVDNEGQFVRTMQYGRKKVKKGLYSPITQNQRHMDLYLELRTEKRNIIMQKIIESNFRHNACGIVVLANPQTVLNDRYAKKEVKDSIIRADQLIDYIKKKNKTIGNDYRINEKTMIERAQSILEMDQHNPVDYVKNLKEQIDQLEPDKAEEKPVKEPEEKKKPSIALDEEKAPLCPVCGAKMIRRTSTRGAHKGEYFWGCSNYPKCRGLISQKVYEESLKQSD